MAWVDRARIGPKAGYVGLASLSPDLKVVVRPKVPVGSILDLIALAYRTARLPTSVGEAALAQSDPLDWLAFLLVAEVEHLLEQGLRCGYVQVTEDIPTSGAGLHLRRCTEHSRGRLSIRASSSTTSPTPPRTASFGNARAASRPPASPGRQAAHRDGH